jgi:tRNA pseudouridine55 synthase
MPDVAFGLLNIDKPLGLTSHDVVNRARRWLGIKRIGHAGTLDPLATGVLILCIGSATRLSEYIMGHTKTYRAEVRLGQSTTTYDAEGEITASNETPITQAQVEAILPSFKGHLQQIPPMYSAIKQDGQKLYELARRGQEVERPPRPVTIYRLQLEAFAYPDVTLLVRCSAGTYIRSLAHDLGAALGVGAHLSGLRRIASGENFTVENAVTLAALEQSAQDGTWQQHLMSVRAGLSHMPYIELHNQQEALIRNGGRIKLGISNRGLVQGWTDEGEFVAVLARQGETEDDSQAEWKPEKVFHRLAEDSDPDDDHESLE